MTIGFAEDSLNSSLDFIQGFLTGRDVEPSAIIVVGVTSGFIATYYPVVKPLVSRDSRVFS